MQLALDDLGGAAVGEADAHGTMLRLPAAQHPDRALSVGPSPWPRRARAPAAAAARAAGRAPAPPPPRAAPARAGPGSGLCCDRPPRAPPAGTGIPSAVKISGVGLKRIAAFGTRSTSSFSADTKVMLAVIPGRSLRSALSTSMTAS